MTNAQAPARTLHVTCCMPAFPEEAQRWVRDLQAALPQADVTLWQPGQRAANHAVVWRPTQQFLDEQPALRALFNAGAGVDGLTALRLPPGAALVRLEDAGMAEQMADYVSHAVLHHFRSFDVYAAQQSRGEWLQRRARDKADYPVGILGAGVLGQAVAQRLLTMGFGVHAWARTPRTAGQAGGLRVHAGDAELGTFLQATRMLVCLLPLTPSTRGIVNTTTLAQLQRGAYLVNAARGGHVVMPDLLQALDSGQLAGATLDVFDDEPLAPGAAAWSHPAIRITPHIAAVTLRKDAIAQIVAKIAAMERGAAISGVVAPQRGY